VKIGLVSPYDYSFPGGVVNHIAYLAHNFIQWGHQVKIIAPCLKSGTRYFEEEVTPVGRPIPIPSGGSIARVPLSPWLPAQVGEILERQNFDILHLHEPFTPMLCLSALVRSNTTNVGTFHAYHSYPWPYRIGRPVFKRLLARLHGKIAVSQPAMEYVSRYLPADYRIIPNGIDTEHFTPDGPGKEEFADGKMNLLFVGRLERRKGLEYLLNACAKVKKEFSNFRLIVVGPGTVLRRKYEAMVKELGIKENTIFVGFIPSAELPLYYRSADIFCAPATGGESFGIVLLEAMACAKPVVATSITGYASVLKDGEEGLLVPPKDDDSLARAILSLIEDRRLRERLGKQGRVKAEKYSWTNIARQVMEFYSSLLSQSRC
jgi:phosphatidylinositol alpha-mannosyltransferase